MTVLLEGTVKEPAVTFQILPGVNAILEQCSIRPHRGKKVIGAVYEISERDLKRLDGYEGYPTVYDRRKVTVWTETNEPIEAITYIKIDQSQEATPSPEHLAIIKQGYIDWQIV